MRWMFRDAHEFNQDISSWDVSNVIDMNCMFCLIHDFNQDLSSWDVSSVSNCDYFFWRTNSWKKPKPNFIIECLTED